jgi:hypothetical protein
MEESMIKNITVCALFMIFACGAAQVLYAGQAGTTDTVFNRRFCETLQSMMPYGQLVKTIGAEGTVTGKTTRASAPAVVYHWKGARNSALDAVVVSGRVIDATVTSPKGKKFLLEKNDH